MIAKVIYNFNLADQQLQSKNEEQDAALLAKLNKNLGLENASMRLETNEDGEIVAVQSHHEDEGDQDDPDTAVYRAFIPLKSMTEGSEKKFIVGVLDNGELVVFEVVDE